MAFINAAINDSSVISAVAGAVIADGAHKAVKFDGDGKAVLAGVGDIPIGVLIGTADNIAIDDDVTILVKDIGYIKIGGTVAKGNAISAAAGGVGVKAPDGAFILGFALDSGASGDTILIQITKSGKA